MVEIKPRHENLEDPEVQGEKANEPICEAGDWEEVPASVRR